MAINGNSINQIENGNKYFTTHTFLYIEYFGVLHFNFSDVDFINNLLTLFCLLNILVSCTSILVMLTL